MATYIALAKWTDQGVRNAKGTVQRAAAYRSDLERRGVKLLSLYWTQGQYDTISVIEAPDTETAMAAVLALGSQGNVRTETLPAFSEREMRSILEKL
jgi:uncharacterized protein with GYD domain